MKDVKNPFLPYIDDFEIEAEEFLKIYCPDVLKSPQKTPIWEIAKNKMNLDIIDNESLSNDESIQGSIIFGAGVVDVYDWSTKEYVGYEVTCPTVFLDVNIFNRGRLNNTLAHECYHHYKHRLYFRYRNKYGKETSVGFRCFAESFSEKHFDHLTDIGKMEYQAKRIAPKLLMPQCTVNMLINKYFNESIAQDNTNENLKNLIEEVSNVYEVSKQSAAIRISELGYPEAYKLYSEKAEIINPRPLPSYTSAKKDKVTISIKDAFDLYVHSTFLREILDTGAFCYAEGYFVLSNEKYITFKDNTPFLTDYAKSHLQECTLQFSYKLLRQNSEVDSEKYLLRSNVNNYKKIPTFNQKTPQNVEVYNSALKLKQTISDFEETFDRFQSMHETTSQTFWRYMENKHWNTNIFQEKTLLLPVDYSRLKNNHKFDIKSYTAMAVGLNLTIGETETALKLSGLCYDEHNREDNAYKFLLTSYRGHSIDECNDLLIALKVRPLGRKTKKSKKFTDT